MIPGTVGETLQMAGERRRDGVRPERREEKQKKNSQYKTDAGKASVFVWDHLLIVFFLPGGLRFRSGRFCGSGLRFRYGFRGDCRFCSGCLLLRDGFCILQ